MALRPTEFKTRHLDRNTLRFLGLLMAGVTLFSVLVLSHQSLRLDESQSLWQTSHSIPTMFKIVAEDVHVPLYHSLLHLWQIWLGNSVALSRDLSLIFFVATIPMVYELASLSFSRGAARFAALMIAVSPFMNWYGSEIRMYSLLTFITVVNQYFYMLIFKRRPVPAGVWWGYALTAFLGAFTHYFFALVLLSQGVFYLMERKLFPPSALKRFVLIAALIAAAMGPWLGYVYSLHGLTNSSPHLLRPNTIDLFNTFSQFIFGFQDEHINTIIVSLWPLAVLLAFLALRRRTVIVPDAKYYFLSAVLPIMAAFIVSLYLIPLFLTRYLILAVPSLYIFLGWIITSYPRLLRNVLKTALVVIMCVMAVQQVASGETPVKENFRQVADYLDTNAGPQDIIVVSAPFTVYPIEYYYRGPAALSTLPIWDRFASGAIPPFDEATLPQQVDQLKGDHQNMWLLLSYDQGYQERLHAYFETRFQRLAQIEFSPCLTLYEYKLRYDVK